MKGVRSVGCKPVQGGAHSHPIQRRRSAKCCAGQFVAVEPNRVLIVGLPGIGEASRVGIALVALGHQLPDPLADLGHLGRAGRRRVVGAFEEDQRAVIFEHAFEGPEPGLGLGLV